MVYISHASSKRAIWTYCTKIQPHVDTLRVNDTSEFSQGHPKRYISAFPSASSSRSLSDFSQWIDKNELVCLNQNNHQTREYNTQRFVDPGTNRACQQLYAKIAVWSKSLGGSKAIPFQDSLMELRWKKAQTWDHLQNPSASTCNLLTLVAISHPMSVCLFEMLTLERA